MSAGCLPQLPPATPSPERRTPTRSRRTPLRRVRETAALLAAAGYRVAATDVRGHGESSTGWASYTRIDVAGDLLALIRHLGGPAVIVGHSFAGGSATIAAARERFLAEGEADRA